MNVNLKEVERKIIRKIIDINNNNKLLIIDIHYRRRLKLMNILT